MNRPTAIERAFEIARSGKLKTVTDVRKQIKDEGYDSVALEGRSLVAQLAALIQEARIASKTIPGDQRKARNEGDET